MAINCLENTNHNVAPELTWKVLVHADQAALQPFQLLLKDVTEHLYCKDIIRIIPGKRLVAFGSWSGKEVVAKLFYERGKAKRHLRRDVEGIEALVQANVPTPPLLYKGSTPDGRVQVLLFEKIAHAKDLAEIWREQSTSDEVTLLMQQVVIELATQHVLGILQCDLHFKNFLVSGNRIYTLDGGGIKKFPDILAKEQSMDNLSLFFAQLGVGTERLQHELFRIYAKSRGWIIKQADFELLKKLVIRKNKARWLRYKNKITRTCSAFVKIAKWNQVSVYDRGYGSSELLDFLQDPEKIFTQPNIEFLKAGRSATVAKMLFNQQYFVVKRYNIKDCWHWLRRCLRSTRAATSWQLAHRLQLFGVATARPIAYVEKRFLGLRRQSYFVMEYIAGQNLEEFFSSQAVDSELAASMANKIIGLLNQLTELNMTHGDLKVSNILLTKGSPILIDLDGMREHKIKFKFKQALRKEIERFMKNWYNRPHVMALFDALLSDSRRA